ncbi:hypothetical protein HRbin32_01648 [bacterium HR32]|nr:hypothetical protein HRbin32_01648 [bacterium HR32]
MDIELGRRRLLDTSGDQKVTVLRQVLRPHPDRFFGPFLWDGEHFVVGCQQDRRAVEGLDPNQVAYEAMAEHFSDRGPSAGSCENPDLPVDEPNPLLVPGRFAPRLLEQVRDPREALVGGDPRIGMEAKHTPEVAPREEDGPRARPAPEHVLLPEVWEEGRNPRVAAHLAHREAVLQAVHVAVPRAQGAVAEGLQGLLHLLPQTALLVRPQVRGGEVAVGEDEPTAPVDFKGDGPGRKQHSPTSRLRTRSQTRRRGTEPHRPSYR